MDKIHSEITILSCLDKNKYAAKIFTADDDGNITKKSYSAGKYFKPEEISVSSLNDIQSLIRDISKDPKKFIIRGKAKDNVGERVQRKIHDPNAAFLDTPRPYIMLDIDNIECPDYFDASKAPEESVKWVIKHLPSIFQGASCYYRFSSSQNVPINTQKKNRISIHLWFWLNRLTSNQEWKQYFKNNQTECLDNAIFSAVQPHFTATPIFKNMRDPLPNRDGILKNGKDCIIVPEIEIPERKLCLPQKSEQQDISPENYNKALDLLLPHYKEGIRNTMCGAIAGTLYRNGWIDDNIAEFIYQIAEKANDPEAIDRQKNVLNICNAIDQNRPVQGIPTLKNELNISNLDEILSLLGIKETNIEHLIQELSNKSNHEEIEEVLHHLNQIPQSKHSYFLGKIKKQTGESIPTLKDLMKDVQERNYTGPKDSSDILMERFLSDQYNDGRKMLKSAEGSYWHYNDKYWERVPIDFIKKDILDYARAIKEEKNLSTSLSNLITSALYLFEGRIYRKDNPLRSSSKEIPSVINCNNGELWLHKNKTTELKPHTPESYLRFCLNVDYNPNASCPKFDRAILEIFQQSSAPEDMVRHFLEVAGYICQPWRKIASIFILIGRGSNGKTSLMEIITRILGEKMVLSDRISNIENNIFKIGALDGKLLLLDDDIDNGTILPDGFLKKISEEKIMSAQLKYKDTFEFICRAVPIMLANNPPSITDLSDGLKRRIRIIPFERQFKADEVKVGLFEEIWKEEASGILNRIIEGFIRLRERGKFEEPKDCITAKTEWMKNSNILSTFIDEECLANASQKQSLKDIYDAFKIYCDENGTKTPLARRNFEGRLKALGYTIEIGRGREKFVLGLCSKDNTQNHERLKPDLR